MKDVIGVRKSKQKKDVRNRLMIETEKGTHQQYIQECLELRQALEDNEYKEIYIKQLESEIAKIKLNLESMMWKYNKLRNGEDLIDQINKNNEKEAIEKSNELLNDPELVEYFESCLEKETLRDSHYKRISRISLQSVKMYQRNYMTFRLRDLKRSGKIESDDDFWILYDIWKSKNIQ